MNQLSNFLGSPKHIDLYYDCCKNKLTSLQGMPRFIGKSFTISDNPKLADVSDIWESKIINYVFLGKFGEMAILPLVKFEIPPILHEDEDYAKIRSIL